MPEDGITVKGWHELAAGTAQLAKNTEATANQNMHAVASQVAGQARGAMPVVSGAMAGSVADSPGPPVSVAFGGGVPYAGWVEFGGTRNRPYIGSGRYFWPQVAAAEPLVVAAAEQAADTETKGMTWPTPT